MEYVLLAVVVGGFGYFLYARYKATRDTGQSLPGWELPGRKGTPPKEQE